MVQEPEIAYYKKGVGVDNILYEVRFKVQLRGEKSLYRLVLITLETLSIQTSYYITPIPWYPFVPYFEFTFNTCDSCRGCKWRVTRNESSSVCPWGDDDVCWDPRQWVNTSRPHGNVISMAYWNCEYPIFKLFVYVVIPIGLLWGRPIW